MEVKISKEIASEILKHVSKEFPYIYVLEIEFGNNQYHGEFVKDVLKNPVCVAKPLEPRFIKPRNGEDLAVVATSNEPNWVHMDIYNPEWKGDMRGGHGWTHSGHIKNMYDPKVFAEKFCKPEQLEFEF